jgi:cell division protein FtsI (penicillin-binding protein 3)
MGRVLMLLVFLGLVARAAHLSVFDEKGAARGDAQSLRTLTLAPERGHILDRRGADLALSIDAPSIFVIRDQIEEPTSTAALLAPIVGADPAALEKKLRSGRGFQFLARWVTDEQAEQARALELEGVGVIKEPRRIYPHRALAARVVGFANIDALGVRGIEQQEDDWLRGTGRRLPVERDGRGRVVMLDSATWGTSGGDIALTLDSTVQADAERALRDSVTATGAKGGIVVAMDPHSGEVLALAEAPSFDPNTFRTLSYDDTGASALLSASEPGSILKPFLIAAALDAGAVAPDTVLDCENGSYRIKGMTIRDTHPHALLDLRGILQVSSNICAVKIVERLGSRAYAAALSRFGLGARTGSDFPDESTGLIRGWRKWNAVDRATMAYGQGLSVTALQIAVATSALANGGEILKPRFIWGRRAAGGPWQPTRREVLRRAITPDTAARVVEMMEAVISAKGTGSRAGLAGLRVAGKTGTAQKFDEQEGRYSKKRYQAWFVGTAPAEAPRIVVVTLLDEPRRPMHTGGMSAAPLFARVATAQLAALGIQTSPQRVRHVATTDSPPPAVSAAPPTEALTEQEGTVSAAPAPVVVAVHQPEASDAAPLPAPPAGPKPVAAQPEPTAAAAKPSPRESTAAKAAEPAAPAPTASPKPPQVITLGSRLLLPDLSGYSVSEVMQITARHGLKVKVSGKGRVIQQDPPAGTVVKSGGHIRVKFASPLTPPIKERG